MIVIAMDYSQNYTLNWTLEHVQTLGMSALRRLILPRWSTLPDASPLPRWLVQSGLYLRWLLKSCGARAQLQVKLCPVDQTNSYHLFWKRELRVSNLRDQRWTQSLFALLCETGLRFTSQVTVWPQQQTGSQGWPSWWEKLEVLTQSSFHSWGNMLRVFTKPALWNRPEVVQVLVLVLVLVCPCCTLWWRAIRISFFRETSNSIYLSWKPGTWCSVWGARCVPAPTGSLKKAVFSIWYMFCNDTS